MTLKFIAIPNEDNSRVIHVPIHRIKNVSKARYNGNSRITLDNSEWFESVWKMKETVAALKELGWQEK